MGYVIQGQGHNYASGAAPAWSPVVYFSGTKYNTFATKKQNVVNAAAALNAAQGRYKTTLVLASAAMVCGAVGIAFSFGAGTAVVGGALATLAGNAILNGQAVVDATGTMASAWVDLTSWVESNCGGSCGNLVR